MNDNKNPNFDFYSFNEQEPKKEETPATPVEETFVQAPDEPVVWSNDGAGEATATPEIDLLEYKGKMRKGYSRVGWCFVAITVVWLISSVILQVIASVAAPELYDTYWFALVSGTVPLYVVCTPLLFLLLQGAPTLLPEKKKLPISHFLILIVLAEAVMVIGSLIGNGLMSVMGLLTGNDFENQLNEAFDTPLWLSFTFSVILAPIFEELIFRKLMMDRMLPYGQLCAILINGILFGAFHGNFFQFFYAAMLGMVLAFLYSKTGKIHHCILIHMTVNFLGGVLPTILYDWLGYDEMLALMENEEEMLVYVSEHILPYLATMAYSALQYGCAVAGVIIFIVNFKKFKLKGQNDLLPTGDSLGASFINSGMIASLVVCAFMFVMTLMSSVAA